MADSNRWNPFAKTPETPTPEVGSEPPATPEKTPAELIAESVSAAIRPLIDANAALNSRLENIETATRRPVKQEPVTPQEVPSVFDNEDAAFAHRVGPVFQRQLETEARLTLNEVKQEYIGKGYADAWQKFEGEIKQVLDGSPLVDGAGKLCRGDSGYIRNVVDMVFGRAAMAAGIKFGGRDRGFFIESAGGDGGSNQAGPIEDGLSVDQRKVFARMGIKTDDAKKTMAKLKFIN